MNKSSGLNNKISTNLFPVSLFKKINNMEQTVLIHSISYL